MTLESEKQSASTCVLSPLARPDSRILRGLWPLTVANKKNISLKSTPLGS
jgi:hypothetical protein